MDLGLTNTALAVLPIAADKNKIAIAVAPAGTAITNEACTPTSIHWMYDTYALAAGTSKVLIDKGVQGLVLRHDGLFVWPRTRKGRV